MRVLGALWLTFGWFIWPVGWAMRECREEVRLGMTRSSWSRLAGREALERGRELNEGAMVAAGE